MGEHSDIEWTEHTWNPWEGCTKISEGCENCYMSRILAQFGKDPTVVRRTSDATFYAPLKWRRPAMVFTCSMSDFFHKDADPWRADAWEVIRRTPHLTYQILTKRIGSVKGRLPTDWGSGWPHVWLGISVESGEYLWRVKTLLTIPAAIRLVSYEPALGPIDLVPYLTRKNETGERLDWVISGGESDFKHPRPANLDWFRAVRDQCAQAGVPFFHKQHGGSRKIDGSWGGHILDGVTHHAFPAAAGLEQGARGKGEVGSRREHPPSPAPCQPGA